MPSVAPSPLQIHVPKRATFKTQPSTLSNHQKPPTTMPQSMSTDAITLNDWYLNGKDLAALLRYNKCELTTLCEQRGLDIDGTKQEMAEALMHWVFFATLIFLSRSHLFFVIAKTCLAARRREHVSRTWIEIPA